MHIISIVVLPMHIIPSYAAFPDARQVARFVSHESLVSLLSLTQCATGDNVMSHVMSLTQQCLVQHDRVTAPKDWVREQAGDPP